MIDVKDIARKVTSGCSHSTPILVPCAGCVEANLTTYESRVRESVKKDFREQWEAMEKEIKRLADEIAAMISRSAALKASMAKTEGVNRELAEKVKALVKERDDLKVCLATEQAYKVNKIKGAA